MNLDEYGFPRAADFDEKQRRGPRSGAVTGRRVVLLVLAILVALAGAALVEFGPEIERKLAQALNLRDRDPEALQQAMLTAVQEKRFGDAAQICGKLLRMQPRNLRLQLLQANLYFMAGDQKRALAACDAVHAKLPNDSNPLHLKASIQAKFKDYKGAVATADAAVKLEPDSPMALNNRAYFRALARTNLKEALADVEEALKQEPDNESYIDTRAYLLYLFGRFDESLVEYNRILENGEVRRRAQEDLGEIYFHRCLVFKELRNERRMKEDYDRARRSGFVIDEEPPPIVKKGATKA